MLTFSVKASSSEKQRTDYKRSKKAVKEEDNDSLRFRVKELVQRFDKYPKSDVAINEMAQKKSKQNLHPQKSWPPKDANKSKMKKAENLVTAAIMKRQIAKAQSSSAKNSNETYLEKTGKEKAIKVQCNY